MAVPRALRPLELPVLPLLLELLPPLPLLMVVDDPFPLVTVMREEPAFDVVLAVVVLEAPDSVMGPPEPRKVCDQSTPRACWGLRAVSTNFTAIRINFC